MAVQKSGMKAEAGTTAEIKALKSQPDSDRALHLLQKIASMVKPIMRNHGWSLPNLSEFFPKNPNLYGINIDRGAKICLRLRPAHDPHSFLDFDFILGTMLHELTHNIRGPHDAIFYSNLDKLTEEMHALLKKGYEGEGFLGRGTRVGIGVGHNVSMAEARDTMLKRVEERARVGKLLGKGGRLGGRAPDMTGKRMSDILAEATERRLRDEKACGHSDAEHGLSPALQAEVDQAEKDSRTLVIDLTLDSDSESDSDATPDSVHAATATAAENNPSRASKVPSASTSSASPTKTLSSTESTNTAVKRNQTMKSSATSLDAPKRKRLTPQKTPIMGPWQCRTCTFDNDAKSIACEMCESARPDAASAAMTASTATLELDDGWICHVCGKLMEHLFWTCSSCSAVKQSSTRS